METSFRTIRCINPTREWKVKPEVNPYQTVRISCREIFFIVRNTRFPWHASSIKVWHVCFSFTIQRNCCIKIFSFENNNDWFINIIYVVCIYIYIYVKILQDEELWPINYINFSSLSNRLNLLWNRIWNDSSFVSLETYKNLRMQWKNWN